MKKPRIDIAKIIGGASGPRTVASQALPSRPGLRFKPGQTVVLPVSAIDWDNKDFNFKGGSDETSHLMGESLEAVGQLSPIHVVWREDTGKAVIVNGFTRAARLKKILGNRGQGGIEVKVLDPALGELGLLRMRSHANLQEKYRPSQWWKLVRKAAPLIEARHGSLTVEVLRKELAVAKTLAEVLVKALKDPGLAKALASDKYGVREIAGMQATNSPRKKAHPNPPGRFPWLRATTNPRKLSLRLVVTIKDRAELGQAMSRGMKEIYGIFKDFAQKVGKGQRD